MSGLRVGAAQRVQGDAEVGRRWKRIGRDLLLTAMLSSLAAGCAAVKPWQRQLLARREMTFESEKEEFALDHTYYKAREGAAGGFESAGGGCGCN
jgi:Domain of unknown function (DUF4266)